MSAPKKTLVYPAWRDPRWLIVLYLLSFVVYALNAPGFSRTLPQYLADLGACLGLDTALILAKGGPLIAPISGLITSMGVLLLCDAPSVWAYALVAALSILSKHFIRVGGRHVFNPNNFGIVVCVLLLSSHVSVSPGRWGGSSAGMIAIALLGLFVSWRAKRLDLSLSYSLGFLGFCFLRSLIFHKPVAILAASMTGAAFQLFTFFMITDPQTSPDTRTGRIAYGLVIAATDSVLRHHQVPNAPFLALFAMCALLSALRGPAGERGRTWIVKETVLA